MDSDNAQQLLQELIAQQVIKLCQAVLFKVQQELIAKSKDDIITISDVEDVFREYDVFLQKAE